MEPGEISENRPLSDRARWIAVAVLAAAYYASGRLGQMLAIPPGNVTAVWPPSGLALGGLFLLGSGIWPGVWLGSFAVNLWEYYAGGGVPGDGSLSMITRAGVAAGIATGSTVQAVLGVRLLQHVTGFRNPLDRVADVFAFVGVAFSACVIAATVGVGCLVAGGLLAGGAFGPTWVTWWLGDAGGILIVAPLLLVGRHPPRIAGNPRRAGEILVLLTLGLAVGQAVFGSAPADTHGNLARAYLVVPFLVWAAFRFAQPGAATAILAVSILAIGNTIRGTGPFTAATQNDSLLRLQAFVSVTALTILALGAAVTERRRAEAELHRSYAASEERVRERTADLAAANADLQREIAERRQAESAMRGSEERFRTLVQAIPDIIYNIDPDGRFTFVNDSIRWYGYEPAELLGAHYSTILHPEDVSAVSRSSVLPGYAGRRTGDERAPKLFDERRTGARVTRNLEVRLLCRGRAEVRIGSLYSRGEVYASGHYGGDPAEGRGEFLGTVGIIRDVTERRKAEDELRKAHDELEVRVRERTEELSAVNANLRLAIAESLQAAAALRESEERYRIVAETATDAILTIDQTSAILYANRAVEEIFGYSPDDLVGRKLTRLMPESLQEKHAAGIRRYLQSGARSMPWKSVELPGLHRSGREIPLEISFGEFVKEDKHYFVGIVRDISDRKRNERMKNEIVATVSHELRTPLTAIHGSLGLIAGGLAGEIAPKVRALVDTARRNSDRLVRLVNDILDVERLERGQTLIRPAPLDLIDLVKQSIAVNRPYGAKFGVRFDLSHNGSSVRVKGDGDRLMQVLTNLLSNAAKFSPPDGTVSVSVARRDEGTVRVSVADRGPGVPEDLRGQIFQKFVQGDPSETGDRTGSGLGLSIAKNIVERHGGRIGFETTAGNGTTFYFDLPCAKS